jgi:hypothetical protein
VANLITDDMARRIEAMLATYEGCTDGQRPFLHLWASGMAVQSIADVLSPDYDRDYYAYDLQIPPHGSWEARDGESILMTENDVTAITMYRIMIQIARRYDLPIFSPDSNKGNFNSKLRRSAHRVKHGPRWAFPRYIGR